MNLKKVYIFPIFYLSWYYIFIAMRYIFIINVNVIFHTFYVFMCSYCAWKLGKYITNSYFELSIDNIEV